MSNVADKLASYAQPLIKPISAEAPSGADPSTLTSFDDLRVEIVKLTSITGQAVNWRLVVQLAGDLTGTVAKDLRVVTWLALGKMRAEGWLGLAEGLTVVNRVTEDFWETLTPPLKRGKARANQAEWLFEQLDQAIPQLAVKPADAEILEVCAQLCESIDRHFGQHLGDFYSARPRAAALLQQRRREVPSAAAPGPAAAPVSNAETTQTANPSAFTENRQVASALSPATGATLVVPAAGGGPEAITANLRSVGKFIQGAARELRQENASKSWAYRLARIGCWLMVQAPPPIDSGSKTRLPAPEADARKRLEALSEAGKWQELLQASEDFTTTYIFWLTPHRYSALALEKLGPNFADASRAVTAEAWQFTQRFPAISSLQFNDGTPFVDAACQAWLDEHAPAGGSGSANVTHQQIDEEDAERQARFESAKALVASSKVDAGVGLAHELARRAPDGRSRFRALLEVANLATLGGRPLVAVSLLDDLAMQCSKHALDEWEPRLSIEVYAALLAARQTSNAPKLREPGTLSDAELLARLCRLAPGQASKFAGP